MLADKIKKYLRRGERRTASLLAGQYSIIGSELIRYERFASSLTSFLSMASESRWTRLEEQRQLLFQQGVAFIQVEVLERYLEDLVDIDAHEEELFISRGQFFSASFLLASLGGLFALGAGSGAASLGFSFPVSLLVMAFVAVPFALHWHLAPSSGLARRMKFAKVVFKEVARRRGISNISGGATVRLYSAWQSWGNAPTQLLEGPIPYAS